VERPSSRATLGRSTVDQAGILSCPAGSVAVFATASAAWTDADWANSRVNAGMIMAVFTAVGEVLAAHATMRRVTVQT